MTTLAIDIETYSSADLAKCGVYRYTQSSDFEILLFAYAYDDEPVEVVDLASGEQLPKKVLKDLVSIFVLKTAHNANFERTCIAKHFNITLPPGRWECTMVKSSMLGLPHSLEHVGRVLDVKEKKDVNGKALIRYFSMPCKPTKANGQRTRNLPEHDTAKWELFKAYCAQDVVTEREIKKAISFFQIPETEKKLWRLDQVINDRGVKIDYTFVKNAIEQDYTYREKLSAEAVELTGLKNPNSAAQLKVWLSEEMDTEVASLKKGDIPGLIENTSCETVERVLNIRQELSKTSVKKYLAMTNAVCKDRRVRGLLQFYGAGRTGRWAGRLVQVQNLPRNELKDLDLARQLVREGDLEMLEMLFGNVPDTLSQLIRTAFVAPADHRFIVADFSAIEARVLAWLANEVWRLIVFAGHGKIYEASAAQMFKVPLESVTKGSDLRQKGKVSELALGYQGGPNALIAMGALKMGLEEKELPALVKMWRNANKAIVKYWDVVGSAAIETVESGAVVEITHGIKFHCSNGILFITLPSGRKLSYYQPHLVDGKFGSALRYWGMDQTTKQWKRIDTYGGKLVENIVQAVARDCLADAMLRLEDAGYTIVMHVHDEIVAEMQNGKGSMEEVNEIMGREIPWATGLLLTADSYETTYYKKD